MQSLYLSSLDSQEGYRSEKQEKFNLRVFIGFMYYFSSYLMNFSTTKVLLIFFSQKQMSCQISSPIICFLSLTMNALTIPQKVYSFFICSRAFIISCYFYLSSNVFFLTLGSLGMYLSSFSTGSEISLSGSMASGTINFNSKSSLITDRIRLASMIS